MKLYDVWIDSAPRPGAKTIACIRGRNISFHVHPADPSDFDQSWELVLVTPDEPTRDRILYTSARELGGPRWSDDGRRIVARIGRRDLVVWSAYADDESTFEVCTTWRGIYAE